MQLAASSGSPRCSGHVRGRCLSAFAVLCRYSRTLPAASCELQALSVSHIQRDMTLSTAWAVLLVSGLFEVAWAVGIKYTDGFTRLWPSLGVLAAMAVSVYGLSLAARILPIGTAYAVWTGVGALGAALVGIAVLGEPRSAGRLACLALIVAGVAGLRLLAESR